MKKTVIIATGNVDADGDILRLDAIKIPVKLPVIRNFEHSIPVGYAENIHVEGNTLKADLEIPDEEQSVWPAIGFRVLESEKDENGHRVIKEMKLYCVSICTSPNVDPNVPPINP